MNREVSRRKRKKEKEKEKIVFVKEILISDNHLFPQPISVEG